MTPRSVAFVIPVRNDAARLRRCLTSIAAASRGFEVNCIVADNGSTDDTPAVAAAAGATVLSIPGCRVSGVRNAAAASASSELLAFVDADHEIGHQWIKTAVELLSDSSAGAAGALCLPPPDGTPVQRMYGFLRGRTTGRSAVTWLGSGNLVVRRAVFEELGGFDERLETCEDVDFCQRMLASGWRLIGDERLINIHLGDPSTLRAVFTSERWRGRDNLRVSLRRLPALRDWPSILIPLWGAAALIALPLGLAVAPLSSAGLPLAASALIVLAGPSALRALRMIARGSLRSPSDFSLAFLVALAYDLGRASSLILPAGHRQRQNADQGTAHTRAG